MKQKSILMLCLGNICRSPLAHGLLEKKATEKKLNWKVDSAGIGHWHIGKQADSRSIATAEAHGLDITNQRARRFEVNDFEKFDTIYAMDHKNYDTLMKLARNQEEKNKVEYIMNEVYPNSNLSVPDPFHDGKEDFEKVYASLELATESIVQKAIA